ncbi:MAG: helix-turn-helix domain-containing protein [Opitutaceae bacterium]|nr:helix-turn-helix domain-containing protein [Opitutaceae bacterium]
MAEFSHKWSFFTMPSSPSAFEIPLGQKPNILHIGAHTHEKTERESYYLPGIWCLHKYQYHADLRLDGQLFKITPGSVSLIPPKTLIEYTFLDDSTHKFIHFHFPGAHPETHSSPYMFSSASLPNTFSPRFDDTLNFHSSNKLKTEVRLWDLLFQLATPLPREETQPRHPKLEEALNEIERQIASPITIPELAHSIGLSHNHLIRLFQKEMNRTIVGYIRDRRVDRAIHLLRNTTLSIKAIAAASGIQDPQRFNKVIRLSTRHSPTSIRALGPSIDTKNPQVAGEE